MWSESGKLYVNLEGMVLNIVFQMATSLNARIWEEEFWYDKHIFICIKIQIPNILITTK